MSVGFLVASFLKEPAHYDSLIQCVSSICKFHTNRVIVVINSLSDGALTAKAIETYEDCDQVMIHVDPSHISACNLVYTYFNEHKCFDVAIILQDSMYLNCALPLEDIGRVPDVMFLWHFTNHRVHWSAIKEPESEYNKAHNIVTHDDLILDAIRTYSRKPEFIKYCETAYPQKHTWVGSFGFTSIIHSGFLEKLNMQTDILHILTHMNDNRQRRASESIFPLACNFVLGSPITGSFDGLYYDGVTYNNHNKGTYFSKISFGR